LKNTVSLKFGCSHNPDYLMYTLESMWHGSVFFQLHSVILTSSPHPQKHILCI